MFKKFLNNILGNDADQQKQQEPVTNPFQQQAARHDNEADDDDDDDDTVPLHGTQYQFDPRTQHGTHYTKDAFDAAANRHYEEMLANQDAVLSENEKRNLKRESVTQLYLQWNGHNYDQLVQFEMANSLELTGYATQGFNQVKEEGNPLYEPIHGISLYDYAGIAHAMAQGVPEETILKAIGIEKAVWEEVNILWPERMKEDASFGIMTKYGEYFATAGQHPKLAHLKSAAAAAAEGNPNLEQLKTDRYFYEELCGARTAAYEYGLDGAQWILENFGINLSDFQAVAMDWMTAQNQQFNSSEIQHYMDYQLQKQKEYSEKFAKEQGGNIADDIAF